MIRRYAKKALLAMAMLCSLSAAAQDRFVKVVVQGDCILGGGIGFDFGGGVNLGKNEHLVNGLISINYGKLEVTATEDEVRDNNYSSDPMGVEYNHLSVPVEVYCRMSRDGGSSLFAGIGAVYNLNMSGKLLPVSSEVSSLQLTDGLNPRSLAARVCAGMTIEWGVNQQLGLKAFLDVNITSALKKYSISDRLFEYVGPIEKAFNRTHLGLAAYFTF